MDAVLDAAARADADVVPASAYGPIGMRAQGGCQQSSAQDQIFYQGIAATILALVAMWRRNKRR